MKVDIRRFERDDLPAVKNLHIKALGSFYLNGPWEKDLDDIENVYVQNGEFLVGVMDNEIIAMGGLQKKSADTAEIRRMRVNPEFQRKGIGQMLLHELEKRARALGFKEIVLDTGEKQLAARNFYEKNGYKKIKTVKETWGIPIASVIYKKSLLNIE